MSIGEAIHERWRALETPRPSSSSSSSSAPASPSASASRVVQQHPHLHLPPSRESPLSSPSKKLKSKKKSKYANAPALFLPPPSPGSSSRSSLPAPPSSATNGTSSSSRHDSTDRISKMLASVDPAIVESRKSLPIWAGKDAIVDAVRQNDTVVILGETGSGKTTQIPQFLFEAGFAQSRPVQMIGITQPRRVAATSLARRVAVEMGCPDPASRALQDASAKGKSKDSGPGLVGYSIRFDDRTSKRTRIKFMTDGMVLREMIGSGQGSRLAGGDEDGDKARGGPNRQQQQSRRSEDAAFGSQGDLTAAATTGISSTLLSRYSVLIIDEAHERTLRTDMVLGLAKRIQRERKALRADWIQRGSLADEPEVTELKIVVMSATLDAKSFANFFASPSAALSEHRHRSAEAQRQMSARSEVPILYVKGRQHAVTTFHTEEPSQEWTDSALRTVLQIHVSRPPGDILVFMTGQEEIETLAKSLETYAGDLPLWAEHEKRPAPMDLMIAPLYAALGPSASVKVFAPTPPRTRKVVLATNIAETSITIPGIIYVIDCGLAKEKVYTATTGVESLQTQEISQSAARQRAGRAGRERSGECYRLYTDEAFKQLPLTTTPEILRTDLAGAVLQLCAMGQDPYHFDWMDQPDSHGLRDAVIQLIQLGAIEIKNVPAAATTAKDGKAAAAAVEARLVLTAVGQKMAMLPVAPFYARALVAASKRGPKVARQVRDMIAVLSADRSVLLDPSDPEKRDEANRAKMVFVHPSGDHGTLLNVLYAYLAEQDAARKIYRAKSKGGHGDEDGEGEGGGEGEGEGKGNRGGRSSGATTTTTTAAASVEMREHVRAWCQNHFVHERAVKNVLHIRKQLGQICAQQGIVCDDTLAMHEKRQQAQLNGKPNGGGANGVRGGGGNDSASMNDDIDIDTDDDDDDDDATTSEELRRLKAMKEGLHVVRKGLNDGEGGVRNDEEDYVELRKCMLEGRFSNAALRTPEGTWKRTGGGQPFRLHPSSTLHATRRSLAGGTGAGAGAGTGTGGKMEALLVEEVVVTTQTYGRTCSVLEPAWLQEILQASSPKAV
ncbi:uncharacterized protein PFL1_06283 [Pseudozyma flocculosa PF-1]|uniref:RNA helicase n=2 Tax=Pseudozyma flocculosa TaxID=84751 RepID=A0A5C3FAJ4_9BASI|nr:uncharacterized protein PFL1_06283 [Pseudozyma flocculosa PF-1]EPQ26075.1 hypothetical protein PFL1_06283 [Pseudozyma flocculosa PF-1]SPO40319.1 related to atp-dependent rna helicase [Pseudozyma flocculosa]